ncbi:UDP-N-acetylmuramoyl-L-alanyl-D-glutamate--2,6-diaminopimelate ligase, partial [Candidatus Shapirobacteria bacterium CG10_big_fil_rev_8_21_14_0_10_38_14]
DFTPQKFKFTTSLPGDYNQYNCLAAIAVCAFLGISAAEIKKAVASFKGVKGRMEEIKEGQDFKVFVDFAHTPAAFEKVIPTVRKMTRGEVIHVFGCTGNRDKSKRSIMGRIAAQLDDKVIL